MKLLKTDNLEYVIEFIEWTHQILKSDDPKFYLLYKRIMSLKTKMSFLEDNEGNVMFGLDYYKPGDEKDLKYLLIRNFEDASKIISGEVVLEKDTCILNTFITAQDLLNRVFEGSVIYMVPMSGQNSTVTYRKQILYTTEKNIALKGETNMPIEILDYRNNFYNSESLNRLNVFDDLHYLGNLVSGTNIITNKALLNKIIGNDKSTN